MNKLSWEEKIERERSNITPHSGLFVVLESGEGAGKTTLAKTLFASLTIEGFDVVLTREPGGTPFGSQLRQIIKHGDGYCNLSELFLFLADRSEHVDKVILPALNDGKIVICDRFTMSTAVYQGLRADSVSNSVLAQLNETATQGITPDITVVMDIDPVIGLCRNRDAGIDDKFERLDINFHRRVRERYLSIAKQDPKAVVVDASQSAEDVAVQAKGLISLALFAKQQSELLCVTAN